MSKPSAPKQPTQQVPEQKPEQTFINGRLVSERLNNPEIGGFKNNVYLSDAEQEALDYGTQQFSDLLQKVPGAIATSDAERKQFADTLYQPQAQRIEKSFQQSVGDATNAGLGSGTLNSLGFRNFKDNQLTRAKTDALSDLANQTEIQSYQLPNLKLDPIRSALSIFDTSIQAPTDRAYQQLEPSFTGSQSASQFDLARAEMANRYRQPAQRGGLFSSFF